MERAVPSMERVIASMRHQSCRQLWSARFPAAERGNFTHFVFVRLTGTRLDTSRFFSRTAAGGVLVTKVKERSA